MTITEYIEKLQQFANTHPNVKVVVVESCSEVSRGSITYEAYSPVLGYLDNNGDFVLSHTHRSMQSHFEA